MKLLRSVGVLSRSFPLLACVALALRLSGQEPARPAEPSQAGAAAASSSYEAAAAEMQLLQAGLTAFQAEDFPAAATKFAAAAAAGAGPLRCAHAYAWLARTYLHLHQIPQAEDAAKKAVESDKTVANAETALAEVYFREGKFDEAQPILIGLVKNQTATARTYLALANLHHASGNYKTARMLVDAARQNDPKDPDVYYAWLRSRSRQERLEEFKKRLAEKRYAGEEERVDLEEVVGLMEDREKNQNRTCKLVSQLNATQVKLDRRLEGPGRLDGYKLAVKVNGVSTSLLLDTGASGVLINAKTAQKAGLAKVAEAAIGGIGDKGAARGYAAFAEKLQIGELQFENCYVEVLDQKRDIQADGLIGADVFESYLVDIDFPNERLRLSQLPPYPDQATEQPTLASADAGRVNLHNRWIPPDYAKFEPVYRFGHMLLLPVRLNKAPYHLFMLDTGAWDNTLTPAAAREVTKLSSDPFATVKGLSGDVKKVYSAGDIMLTFGSFQQHREDLLAFDLSGVSNSVGTEISGALGFAMLYLLDIKLDYRDNLVNFSYDPNRFH